MTRPTSAKSTKEGQGVSQPSLAPAGASVSAVTHCLLPSALPFSCHLFLHGLPQVWGTSLFRMLVLNLLGLRTIQINLFCLLQFSVSQVSDFLCGRHEFGTQQVHTTFYYPFSDESLVTTTFIHCERC